jgi:uncharacterized protein YjbJ (UPF0337 family)
MARALTRGSPQEAAAQSRARKNDTTQLLTGNVYAISPLARHTYPEGMMSRGTTDKIKGATNEAVGKAKRAVGKATGSAKLKREGDIQEAKGDAQTAMGKVKKALKG